MIVLKIVVGSNIIYYSKFCGLWRIINYECPQVAN